MTPAQRTHLFADLWPAACAAQHWDPRDRERRLEVCGDAVSRTISSANDLDSKDDYTAVKRHLLILAGDLKAAGEGAEANGERTRRWKIKQQLRCLAIYPLETPMGLTGAEAYIRSLIRDQCHRAGYEPNAFDSAPFLHILDQLRLSDLTTLVRTLDNRLHHVPTGFRVAAHHTLADMRRAAGI